MGGLRQSGRMGRGGTSLFTLFSLVVFGFGVFFLSAGIVFKERKNQQENISQKRISYEIQFHKSIVFKNLLSINFHT